MERIYASANRRQCSDDLVPGLNKSQTFEMPGKKPDYVSLSSSSEDQIDLLGICLR